MASEIFLSYTTVKDPYGGVSAFQERLENEVRQKSGKTEISIFQDKKGLRFGENFKSALLEKLNSTKILLILYSPTWINSEWCRWEYTQFCKDSTRPVVVVKWDDLYEDAVYPEGKDVFNQLNELHYLDWAPVKYKDWNSEEKNLALAKLATQIVEYLI